MELTRLAALLVLAGGTLLTVAVGFLFGVWFAVGLSGGLLMAAGIQTLRSPRG